MRIWRIVKQWDKKHRFNLNTKKLSTKKIEKSYFLISTHATIEYFLQRYKMLQQKETPLLTFTTQNTQVVNRTIDTQLSVRKMQILFCSDDL